MTWKAMMRYNLENTDLLNRTWIKAKKPRVVMIDPPTSFLGDIDEHKNTEVRRVIMKLVGWMESCDPSPAIIFITHVNKGGGGVDAISRVIGSVAWMTTSRIGHIFAPDSESPDRVFFLSSKNNLGPKAKGMAYRIVKTETFAKVEWLGETTVTADEAMAGTTSAKPRRVNAAKFLIDLFNKQQEWPSDDLFEAAREAGISRQAIFEAKDRLQLPKARRTVLPDGDVKWVWWVPADWEHLIQDKPEERNGAPF